MCNEKRTLRSPDCQFASFMIGDGTPSILTIPTFKLSTLIFQQIDNEFSVSLYFVQYEILTLNGTNGWAIFHIAFAILNLMTKYVLCRATRRKICSNFFLRINCILQFENDITPQRIQDRIISLRATVVSVEGLERKY